MYVIVRKDLKPGEQLAQSCHVCFQFALDNPNITGEWIRNSNYICILEIDNEAELIKLYTEAINKGIIGSCFMEPDFNNEMTAIALAPGMETKKLCSNLKLALKI